jgi:radical SAM protein with 4Fe4S-binding SPASM domain
MDWDHRYKTHSSKIKLRRRDQILYFFHDIPYWLVTDSDGETFLDALDGTRTIREITADWPNPTDPSVLEEFLQPLIEAEAVLRADEFLASQAKQFDIASVKPGIAILHITDKCNLSCKHCYVPGLNKRHQPEMTTAEMKGAIKELDLLMDHKRRTLNFLGGEPTLRKDLVELLNCAGEYGFLLFVSSNGTKITPVLAKALVDLNVRFQISLDGANRETHELMRGHGSWDKTWRGINTLLEAGVKPVVNMVFHQGNIEQIPAFIDLAKSLGIDARFIPLVEAGRVVHSDVRYAGIDRMVDIVAEKLRADPKALDTIRASYFMALVATLRYSQRCMYCGTGLYTILVRANGDIYPCSNMMLPEFKLGNILEGHVIDLYRDSSTLKMLRQINVEKVNPRCGKCKYKYLCGSGCRGETLQATGDLYGADIHCTAWIKAINKIFWFLIEFPELMEIPVDTYLPQVEMKC